MEDKIEVNEYVRTKNGFIYRIENGEEFYADSVDVGIGIIPDVDGIWIDKKCLDYIDKRDIIKHSKQLINLVEVKDVIRYRIDNISTTLETKGYVEGIVDISDEEMLQKIKSDKNYHILEILTKEQFEANCYKVGGKE